MLALLEHEESTHEPCGQPLGVSMNDEMEGGYEVTQAGVCHACAELGKERPERVAGEMLAVVQKWDPEAKKPING